MDVPWPMSNIFSMVRCCAMQSNLSRSNHSLLDIEIATNGIYITRDMTDTALGAGFVAFISMDNAYRAIDLYHQKYMGDRFAWT